MLMLLNRCTSKDRNKDDGCRRSVFVGILRVDVVSRLEQNNDWNSSKLIGVDVLSMSLHNVFCNWCTGIARQCIFFDTACVGSHKELTWPSALTKTPVDVMTGKGGGGGKDGGLSKLPLAVIIGNGGGGGQSELWKSCKGTVLCSGDETGSKSTLPSFIFFGESNGWQTQYPSCAQRGSLQDLISCLGPSTAVLELSGPSTSVLAAGTFFSFFLILSKKWLNLKKVYETDRKTNKPFSTTFQ